MAAPPTDMLVFLVRHAEPAGPGGKRFLGQDDPPLSRTGEEQARLLGARPEDVGQRGASQPERQSTTRL